MTFSLSKPRLYGRLLALGIGLLALSPARSMAADWTVGATIGNLPWEFQQQDDSYVGFEIDLINEAAKRLGRSVEIQNFPFEGVIPGLLSNRIQIGLASMTITQDRLKSLAFAQPYYDSDQSLTAMASSGIASLDSIKGKTIGVDSAATSDLWATAHQAEYKFAGIQRYDSMNSAVLDLQAGRIDAYIADIPAIAYYIKDKPQFHIVDRIATGEQYSLIMNKGFADIQAINDTISAMKRDGFMAALHKKWFGTDAAPGSSTLAVKPLPKAE